MANIESKNRSMVVGLIVLFTAFIWLKSNWGKLSAGNFVEGMPKTLAAFSAKNPYPWMKSFLDQIATPNASLFGNLVMWGELLTGLSLLVAGVWMLGKNPSKLSGLLLSVGLLGGFWLNLVFYFAAGWTGASTESVNLYMAGVELILLLYNLRLLKT